MNRQDISFRSPVSSRSCSASAGHGHILSPYLAVEGSGSAISTPEPQGQQPIEEDLASYRLRLLNNVDNDIIQYRSLPGFSADLMNFGSHYSSSKDSTPIAVRNAKLVDNEQEKVEYGILLSGLSWYVLLTALQSSFTLSIQTSRRRNRVRPSNKKVHLTPLHIKFRIPVSSETSILSLICHLTTASVTLVF